MTIAGSTEINKAGLAADALHGQMHVRYGALPSLAGERLYDDHGFALTRDEFQFTTPGGNRFHYARGAGIVAQRPLPADEDEFRLYLWGTVFGAVAWLNQLIPLHASAVVKTGRAIAFTADSGGGKSTLATALAGSGYAHLCDDTLAVHLVEGRAFGLPDRKPAKLWDDAFGLVSAVREAPIAAAPGKSYAVPPGEPAGPAELTDLIVLRWGSRVRLTPVHGSAKLVALSHALYRDFVPAAIGDAHAFNTRMIALTRGLAIWTLERPRARNRAEFDQTLETVEGLVAGL
jgi:hypothetical protein